MDTFSLSNNFSSALSKLSSSPIFKEKKKNRWSDSFQPRIGERINPSRQIEQAKFKRHRFKAR